MIIIFIFHSFCTVLEYVPGNDLDFLLKQNKTIPEKEVLYKTYKGDCAHIATSPCAHWN